MVAVFACDRSYFFDDLCTRVQTHDPSGILGPLIERLIGPLVIFALVFVLGRALRRFVDRAVARSGGDVQVRALVRNVGAAVIYFFAIVSGLVTAGVNAAFILTFGGLASLAIGLAFQDVLRNVLAGIWLLLERPFRIGDVITLVGVDMTGVVQTITLRTTAMRTGDGRLAVVPNLTVFSGVVVNGDAYPQRRYTVALRLERDRDLEAAIRAARREMESIGEVARDPAPAVMPILDGEGMLLNCNFWMDHRTHNADAVTAEVARRLWVITERASAPSPGAAQRES